MLQMTLLNILSTVRQLTGHTTQFYQQTEKFRTTFLVFITDSGREE